MIGDRGQGTGDRGQLGAADFRIMFLFRFFFEKWASVSLLETQLTVESRQLTVRGETPRRIRARVGCRKSGRSWEEWVCAGV